MKPKEWEVGAGGVDIFACKHKVYYGDAGKWQCHCGRCAKCGYTLHSAVHGHPHGGKPGDKPFDHQYVPKAT